MAIDASGDLIVFDRINARMTRYTTDGKEHEEVASPSFSGISPDAILALDDGRLALYFWR